VGIYPEKLKAGSQRDISTLIHNSFIHNSKKLETTQVSING
jgi:hypothetical protein